MSRFLFGAMPVGSRRLFAVILLSQIGCVAVGLAFHHLYLSSSVSQAETDGARAVVGRQFAALSGALEQQTAASLKQDPQAWQRALVAWRAVANHGDRIVLLDQDGQALIAADEDSKMPANVPLGQPLSINRPSQTWGHFEEPIRGSLPAVNGVQQVALARGFAARDGYLLIAHTPSEPIEPAKLKESFWAAGFITLLWTLGLSAVTLFMILTRSQRSPANRRSEKDVEALKQAQALVRTQETVIFGLAKLSDSRDPETGMHLERIAQFSSMLASALRQRPDFRDRITPGFVQLIGISSALHDIGKVGVEDSILRKPGTLSKDERERMQRHTQIGEDCLKEIERRLGSSNFLQMAREIVSAHHEWWDGQGYPLGLAGEKIPLSARIVAVADVYDALRSKRVYKDALPHEQCVSLIAEASGTQFDPRLVEVFLQIEDRFRQLADQMQPAGESCTPDNSINALPGAEHVSVV